MEILNKLANYLYVGIIPNSVSAFCGVPTICTAVVGDWKGFAVSALLQLLMQS